MNDCVKAVFTRLFYMQKPGAQNTFYMQKRARRILFSMQKQAQKSVFALKTWRAEFFYMQKRAHGKCFCIENLARRIFFHAKPGVQNRVRVDNIFVQCYDKFTVNFWYSSKNRQNKEVSA